MSHVESPRMFEKRKIPCWQALLELACVADLPQLSASDFLAQSLLSQSGFDHELVKRESFTFQFFCVMCAFRSQMPAKKRDAVVKEMDELLEGLTENKEWPGPPVAELRSRFAKYEEIMASTGTQGLPVFGLAKQFAEYCNLSATAAVNDAVIKTFALMLSTTQELVPAKRVKSPASRCMIATAAYGTPWHPEVIRLRQFRDTFLRQRVWGRGLVRLYELASPPIAQFVSGSAWARMLVRRIVIGPLRWVVEAAFKRFVR